MKPTSSSCVHLVFFLPHCPVLPSSSSLSAHLSVCAVFEMVKCFQPFGHPSLSQGSLGVKKQISSVHPFQQAPGEPPSTPTGFSRTCQQQPVFLALKKSWDHLFLLSAVTADLFVRWQSSLLTGSCEEKRTAPFFVSGSSSYCYPDGFACAAA